jgi:hypothetical protein
MLTTILLGVGRLLKDAFGARNSCEECPAREDTFERNCRKLLETSAIIYQ